MPDDIATAKHELRADLVGRRDALSETARRDAGVSLATHVGGAPVPTGPGVTICAYVSVGTEPPTGPLIAALADTGARVLLPISLPGPPAPLEWAAFDGPQSLASGRFGLLEPTGERLGPTAVRDADLVLVPALAVDVRGFRLGRGAGFYDRSLVDVRGVVTAVVYDDEVLPSVPGDTHDVSMTWALTPAGGFRRLDR
ncbi:5-formyltetrahydrofolate cyclo-ligase [Williamsia deligens]|uniref:5-formyltetrahydrofolate cyclo-ligase n=1 Tax=Williamsia deligens TaxID=321325 RepID=A0ABW3G941_9NOCA|nr:5-formyltetrahydrofolate cyclo-ligase [Williamsia deligens]MCP2192537.1 5-formyltetrahydrofolate cyclo-ligase [Williamsia deligens]